MSNHVEVWSDDSPPKSKSTTQKKKKSKWDSFVEGDYRSLFEGDADSLDVKKKKADIKLSKAKAASLGKNGKTSIAFLVVVAIILIASWVNFHRTITVDGEEKPVLTPMMKAFLVANSLVILYLVFRKLGF